MTFYPKITLPALAVVFAFAGTVPAQDEQPQPKTGDVRKIAFPSPYVRMLGIKAYLEQEGIEVDWSKEYNRNALRNLKVDSLPDDEGTLCTAIGVRLADGAIALLGKDEDKMNRCAKDVQALAKRLGATADDLPAVNQLVRSVEGGDWSKTFFELGMIQQEVVAKLDNEKDSTATVLVATGAWLQGIVYASNLIIDHQDDIDLSNMVRAPQIANFLALKLNELPEETKKIPQVKTSVEILGKVEKYINIGRDETIEKSKLEALRDTAASALTTIKGK